MTEKIRLLLVEDHAMVRAGFRMLLGAQEDMEIVGEAESGRDAVDLVREARPDVVLLDIAMPDMEGPEVARAIKTCCPGVAVLVVTIHGAKAYLLQMLDAGADGYVPKRAAADELVDAIRAVHAGRRYIHHGLVDLLVEGYRTRSQEDQGDASTGELTPRQLQVLRLVADGLTSQKAGDELGLSARTIDRHIENVMNRLHIRTRMELVKYAIRQGWVEIKESGDAS